MTFKEAWKRLLMMVMSFPLAVLGNVLRLMFIVITAQMRGQAAGNYVHESPIFSLVPYVATFVGVIVIGNWMGKRREPLLPMTGTPA
jgi:exosortase/archaeosortase family protein